MVQNVLHNSSLYKANKQYIKEYDKELIYLTYWDVIGMYVTKVADLWF